MPEIHNKRVYEIYKADDDEKGQIIMLPETSLLAPPSTVYQGDVFRYYKANPDWSRVIEGFLLWLAESPAWKNAEHEGFDAIQQILIFLEGVEVEIDCQQIEDCLVVSPTIININNEITTIEGDITNVTNTVNNHTTEITELTENVTNITENATYNEFPEEPDPTEVLDSYCGSAHAIANYLNEFVQDVIVDAQTITFPEFVTAILGLGGFKASLVKILWDLIVVNVNPNLSNEVSDAIPYVAEAFFCANLQSAAAKSAIDIDSRITTDAQATYVKAIEALTTAKYSELIYLGSLDEAQDCASFACGCSEYDFTKSLHGFTVETEAWHPGLGLGARKTTGGRFNFYVMTHYFNVTNLELDWYMDGTWGDFRDLDILFYRDSVLQLHAQTAPNINFTSGTTVWNSGVANVNGIRIYMRHSGNGATGRLYTQKLRIYGTPVTGRPQNSAPSC